MKEDIQYIIQAVMFAFMGAALFLILECFDSVQNDYKRLEMELQKTNAELIQIKKDLQFNNAICEKVISGNW